jgi:hypothetical protein
MPISIRVQFPAPREEPWSGNATKSKRSQFAGIAGAAIGGRSECHAHVSNSLEVSYRCAATGRLIQLNETKFNGNDIDPALDRSLPPMDDTG